MLQPFVVEHGEQLSKARQVLPGDLVVLCVLSDGGVGDRKLATERAIDAIVAERLPGLEIEFVPWFRLELVGVRNGDEFRLFRVFVSETA